MQRSWTVGLFRHEQPDAKAWDALERLATGWSGDPSFTQVMDGMWLVNFDEATRPALDRLLQRLSEVERETGAVHHLTWRDALEPVDYEQADFIELLGVELATEPAFVLNEAQALAPGEPCPRCGSHDIFDAVQTEPFVLDEARLDQPAADDSRPGPEGWDVVTLPNGHKLVSRRLVAVLERHDVRGYELHDVIDSRTGDPSERMTQITATTTILTPCDSDAFCPVCGTAQAMPEGPFRIRMDEIGDAEVISRHRGGGALLYLSRRVFDLIAGFDGATRNSVLMAC